MAKSIIKKCFPYLIKGNRTWSDGEFKDTLWCFFFVVKLGLYIRQERRIEDFLFSPKHSSLSTEGNQN